MRRRILWFFAVVLLFPIGAGVYLLSAPPQSNVGSGYKTVELSDIVGNPLDPAAVAGGQIPASVMSLDGRWIMLEGQMLTPPGGQLAPNEFLLIDRSINSQGSVKEPWQYVLVRMPPDKHVQWIAAPLQIYGRFHAGPRRDQSGRVTSIYQMDGDWMLVP